MGKTALRALAVALTALAVLSSGCVDEARIFYIRQNQVPSSGCKIATTTTIYNPMGRLDVSVGQGYWLYPLMENALTSTTTGDGEPERNALILKGFEVELDLQGMNNTAGLTIKQEQLKFWLPATGYLGPGGKLAGSIRVIPDWLAAKMGDPSTGPVKAQAPSGGWPVIYAIVTAVASKTGSEVESAIFVYPIEICNGCLVDKRTTCPADPSKDKALLSNYCGLPQDQVVTCCPKNKGYGCYSSGSDS